MFRFVRLLLFVFCFQAELHVKASDLNIIEIPDKCANQFKVVCHLKIRKGLFEITDGISKVHLKSGASVIIYPNKEVEIIEGLVWVEKSGLIKLTNGTAKFHSVDGEFILSKKKINSKTVIYSLYDQTDIELLKEKIKIFVSYGFSMWLSGYDENGKLARGVMHPFYSRDVVMMWLPFNLRNLEKFGEKVDNAKVLWDQSTKSSAEIYKKVVERKLASMEEEKLRKIRNARHKQEEEARLRLLYRQKNGLE